MRTEANVVFQGPYIAVTVEDDNVTKTAYLGIAEAKRLMQDIAEAIILAQRAHVGCGSCDGEGTEADVDDDGTFVLRDCAACKGTGRAGA